MGKYSYLNLNQKMSKIRKKVPALVRKRYSEEVPYDFVKPDDIYAYLTPALNKYGVDFDVVSETPTQKDATGNPVYLTTFGNLWQYEADLKICWTNADHPEEKSYSDIHVVGTNEIPDKAKGSAWSYGLKYYLLNKFNIVQAGADDPDMRGTIDGKPKEERENVTKEKEPKQSPMQGPENNTVKSEKRQKEAKKLAEHPPKSEPDTLASKENRSSNPGTTSKTVRFGNAVSQKTKELSEDSIDLEISPDEVPDLQMEQEDNLPGQMTFGMEKSEFSGKNDKYSQEPENEMEANENEGLEPDSEEGDPEFRAVEETDEVPFEEAEEEFTEEFEAQEKEESEPDEVAKARNMVCDFGLFKGYTLGEMMTNVKGRATVKWLIDKYNGGNIELKKAARFLLEQEEKAAA